EGVRSVQEARDAEEAAVQAGEKKKKRKKKEHDAPLSPDEIHLVQESVASRIARRLQQMTGVEARVTSLGHVQRGGEPTTYDRLLATRFGSTAGQLLADGVYNVIVTIQGGETVTVHLRNLAGIKKVIPLDNPRQK